MSNEKQTSVEWLFLMLNNPNRDQQFANKLLEQAKEMYNKELELAYEDGKEISHILNTIEKNKHKHTEGTNNAM